VLLLLLVSLLLFASRLWQAFLLLLASVRFLIISVVCLSAIADVSGVTNGVVGVSAVPFCSTTGKPTHLFRTKCVSLDSV
jgi:membrane-bound ClpP family serine protease